MSIGECKNNLVLCEVHNKYIHGYYPEVSSLEIKGHYLCHYIFKNEYLNDYQFEDYDDDDDDSDAVAIDPSLGILNIFNLYTYIIQKHYTQDVYIPRNMRHDFIRNYKSIVSKENYLSPQIAQVVRLPKGEEDIAILKTFWIRCVQRCWRKLVSQRKYLLQIRKHPNQLIYRTANGKWHKNCCDWPEVTGMFWHSIL